MGHRDHNLKHAEIRLTDTTVRVSRRDGRTAALTVADLDGVVIRPPKLLKRGSLVMEFRRTPDFTIPLAWRDRDKVMVLVDALSDAYAAHADHQDQAPPPTNRETRPTRSPGRPLQPATAAQPQALFQYPAGRGGQQLDRFAVIDLETSGLSPRRGARIVEVAIVTVEAGQVVDTWTTLINPGRGKNTGPAHIHRITDGMVADAPHLRDVAGEIESRLSGAVVVAHNAEFEARFLHAAFDGIGRTLPQLPALDTLHLARQVAPTPNHRLPTVARWAGVPHREEHTALGDAQATAGVLGALLQRTPAPQWHIAAPTFPPAQTGRTAPRPPGDPFEAELAGYAMAEGLRKGEDGWIANLLARMPSVPSEPDSETAAYVELLTRALEDGKIVGSEARELAILAGTIGLTQEQARDLHIEVLDGMHRVALDDGILTADEYRLLQRAAGQVGVPGHFQHLETTVQPGSTSRTSRRTGQTRCGNCGETGHNRRTCTAARAEAVTV